MLVTGYDLGVDVDGGFGQYIAVPANWAVACPEDLTLREAMSYGTAGFTAALCVQELAKLGLRPNRGRIVVTGATGGVGSTAVALLAAAGFSVTAVTGKPQEADKLKSLGASEVVGRDTFMNDRERQLLAGQWAGAVDTAGGELLAQVLKGMQPGGGVTCCGMVAGTDLNVTVFPFILRAVHLVGIDSVHCNPAVRTKIWNRLAGESRLPKVFRLARECTLDELSGEVDRMLVGDQVGRVVVKVS